MCVYIYARVYTYSHPCACVCVSMPKEAMCFVHLKYLLPGSLGVERGASRLRSLCVEEVRLER